MISINPSLGAWGVGLATALFWQAGPVLAWKVDAHVWIASEVLKDARDGSLSFRIDDRIVRVAVPSARAEALRANPRPYLLGSLGPDAFPDVIGGQIVIHPSFNGGWGTADWLQRIYDTPNMSSDEIAFTMGYLSHAAGDTFAHTFVNRYAGDLFEIFEHPSAATRHINIEGLVSNYLPPISVPGLGGPTDAASLLRIDGHIGFPERLMRDRILLDGEAADQFNRGGAKHLALAYGLYRDLGNLVEEGGPLEDLQAKIKDFIAELYLEAPIDDRLTEKVNRLENQLHDWMNEQAEDLRPVLNDLSDQLAEIEGMPVDLSEKGLKEAVSIAAKIAELDLELDKWERKLLSTQSKIDDLVARGLDTELVRGACETWAVVVFGPAPCLTYKSVPVATSAKKALDRQLIQAADFKSRLKRDLLSRQNDLKEAITKGMDLIRATQELNHLSRQWLIAMGTDRPFGDGVRNMFLRWRDGIPVALVEFTRANAETIVNSVDPRIVKGHDPEAPGLMDPLSDWKDCYGPVFLGIPATVGTGVCATMGSIRDIQARTDEFEAQVAKVLSPIDKVLDLKKQILTLIETIKDEVLDQAILSGLKGFDAFTNLPTAEFYQALAEEITPDKVDAALLNDSSGQHLPLVDHASARVIGELRLNDRGQIDPDAFPAIYDSIVLAKLALLDTAGLTRLAREAGVTDSTYYSNGLFGDGSPQARNVLFGFLRSIDGNHQWQMLAPPHPRDVPLGYDQANFDQRRDDPKNHGYGLRDKDCRRVLGMRYWVDAQARESIFKKLFKGGLTLGIDDPEALGFGPALPAGYPNLYNRTDGWWRDAIEWDDGTDTWVTAHLVGRVPIRTKATLVIPGLDPMPISLDADGNFDLWLPVRQSLLPARFEIIEDGTRSGLRYGFDIGCDGAAVSTGTPVHSIVIVERG